jgi:hypothetical protein
MRPNQHSEKENQDQFVCDYFVNQHTQNFMEIIKVAIHHNYGNNKSNKANTYRDYVHNPMNSEPPIISLEITG